MSEEKLTPKQRKAAVLQAAVELCKTVGIDRITRDEVARRAGVGHGTVTLYFNTMIQLRRAVARHGMSEYDPEILAQLLVHPTFKDKLSDFQRKTALQHLAV